MTEKTKEQSEEDLGEILLGVILLVGLAIAMTMGLNGSFPSYESLFKPTHTLTQETKLPSIFSLDIMITKDGVASREEMHQRCTLAAGTTVQFAFHSGKIERFGRYSALYGYKFNQHGKVAQAKMPCNYDTFISEVESTKAKKLFNEIEDEKVALEKANQILSTIAN